MSNDFRFEHYRRGVRVCAIVILIIGILATILSIFVIVMGPLVGVAATDPGVSLEFADVLGFSPGDGSSSVVLATVGVFLTVMGIVSLVSGVIDIVTGALGLRGANQPDKIGPFWVLSIIALVAAIASAVTSIVMAALGGADIWGNLATVLCSNGASIVFDALCVFYAGKVRSISRAGSRPRHAA